MKIHDRVRIKSGPFFNSENPKENFGRVMSVQGNLIRVDMDDCDDLDDGNVLPVELADLEII